MSENTTTEYKSIKTQQSKSAEKSNKKGSKKTQFAVPCEVSEVKGCFCAEKCIVGYNVTVKFKAVSGFPCPSFLGYKNIHIYTDIGGTSQVVYHFPFIGYGIINPGKLYAKHWYKKMKKQVDVYNAQQKIK